MFKSIQSRRIFILSLMAIISLSLLSFLSYRIAITVIFLSMLAFLIYRAVSEAMQSVVEKEDPDISVQVNQQTFKWFEPAILEDSYSSNLVDPQIQEKKFAVRVEKIKI